MSLNNSGSGPLLINKETFEKIYNLYWERVYAVCYNNIREVEPSREMVQDIFKSLWERRHSLQLYTVENYLIRSAKFKTFEYIRNKVSRQQHIEYNTRQHCLSTNCTEEHVMFNNLREKVKILVDRLPCQCKRVYRMSRDEGYTNKEIASALFISERAVEYHITKALATLRTSLSSFRN